MEDLTGRTAVITGGASGIGLEFARTFGAAGMNLVLADIEEPALDSAAQELIAAGHQVVTEVVDVRHLEEIQKLEAKAREAFGNVHLLCNNAGVAGGGPVTGLDDLDLWKWTIDINLWGVIYGCKVFLPGMVAHGEPCHIVNTASMAGHGSAPLMGAYNVSKYGVVALSETLSREMQMGGTAVGVSVLCPAFVATGIADSTRNLPDDLAQAAEITPETEQFRQFVSALVDGGISTEVVAAAVHDAVVQNRFWILTHEESKAGITNRAREIVEGVNPTLGIMGGEAR